MTRRLSVITDLITVWSGDSRAVQTRHNCHKHKIAISHLRMCPIFVQTRRSTSWIWTTVAACTAGLPCIRTWGTGSGCCRWPYTGTWPARDTLNSWQAETSVRIQTDSTEQSSLVRRLSLRATLRLDRLESRGEVGRGGRVGETWTWLCSGPNRGVANATSHHACSPRSERPSVVMQEPVQTLEASFINCQISLFLSLCDWP